MELPQELVEEIISYIPPDDHQSLLNYSLVAKSWVYPSRRRIFKTVDIWSDRCLNLWLAAISPTNVGVLQHVRSLTCKIASTPDSLRPSVDPLRDYLPSFRQLERLSFFSGFVPSLTQISAYSPFQHTLSYLFLRCFDVTASAVVTVVNYFPNLAHLEVGELSNVADDQPVLPFSRPLQKLTITNLNTIDGVVFLDQLMGLRPRCDEVTIGTYESSCRSSLAQCIINGVEASVKRLNLRSIIPCAFSVPIMVWRRCLNVMLEFHHRSRGSFDALKLPRAPRARDPCVASGDLGIGPYLIHHFYKH